MRNIVFLSRITHRGASPSCWGVRLRTGDATAERCRVGCPYLSSVAQIANLPFRRLPIGRASANVRRDGTVDTLQDGILRHLPAPRLRQAGSRLAVCATDSRKTLTRTAVLGQRSGVLSQCFLRLRTGDATPLGSPSAPPTTRRWTAPTAKPENFVAPGAKKC